MRTWEKTRLSYLVRHKRTGGYYARAYANGKEVWRSLKTKHFSVAEARLAEFLKGHRETRNAQAQASSAKLTFGTAAEIYRQRLNDNVKIKPHTPRNRLGAYGSTVSVRSLHPGRCSWLGGY